MTTGPTDDGLVAESSSTEGRCPVCQAETARVSEALELLGAKAPGPQQSNLTIRELLSSRLQDLPLSKANADFDSLDQVELLMALEEEHGAPATVPLLEEWTSEHVFKTLLGPASSATSWAPVTIWARSVRGIVNERVRCMGGCSCGAREEHAVRRRVGDGTR